MPKYNFDLPYTPPNFARPELAAAPNKTTESAPADGLAPVAFYASTNFPTYIKQDGEWRLVRRQRMDACIVWEDKVKGEEAGVKYKLAL